MLRIFLRPLLVFLTLGLLLGALLQSAGRLSVLMLDDLEMAANQWLADRQIRLVGLRGGWHVLNPIVHLDRVEFPGGYVTDATVEADWLESLIRNRVVVSRAVVGDVMVRLERRADGTWVLPGMTPGGTFDLSGLLYHSDQLSVAGSAIFAAADSDSAPLKFVYTATNRGGVHRHRVELHNQDDDCSDDCAALLRFEAREALWPLWPGSGGLRIEAGNFRVPGEVLGRSGIRLHSVSLAWHQLDEASAGSMTLDLDEFQLPGSAPVTLTARADVVGDGSAYRGVVTDLALSYGTEAPWGLPDVHLTGDAELAQVWLPELDLGQATDFVRAAFAGVGQVRLWADELDPQGRALNVRAYLRLPTREFGYAATLADAQMEGYKGAPYMRRGAGEVLGYRYGMRFVVNAEDAILQFPDVFQQRWPLRYTQGTVDIWFKDRYVGLRGRNIRAETPTSRASGGFSVTRPPEIDEQRLTLLLKVDRMTVAETQPYVPIRLPTGLAGWLEYGPREGVISDARLAYHGQLRPRPGQLARRLELTGRLSEGVVQFHPDWPIVSAFEGDLAVAGSEVRVGLKTGRTAAAELTDSRVVLGDNAAYADVSLNATQDATDSLAFIRGTPLSTWLAFVGPEWVASGRLGISGSLHVPLKRPDPQLVDRQVIPDTFDANLRFRFDGVDLAMPDYRFALAALQGGVKYRYPHQLSGQGLTAQVFGRPATLEVDSEEHAVNFKIRGVASQGDVFALIDQPDPGLVAGQFEFAAELGIGVTAEHMSRLDMTSDLTGLQVLLPAGFGKPAEEPRPATLRIDFLPDFKVLSFHYASATGWLHVAEGPLRGAIGFDAPPPWVDIDENLLVLAGHIDGFALDEVIPDADADADGGTVPLPVQLRDLHVARILIGKLAIEDVVLGGSIGPEGLHLELASESVGGTVELPRDAPLELALTHVVLPEGTGEGDPLDPAIIGQLPKAHVSVDHFQAGKSDFGSWQFDVQPEPGAVRFVNLQADLRGVKIVAEEGIHWSQSSNRSRFVGKIDAGNMAEVMPLWGYAPSFESKSAQVAGTLGWAGSPANVAVALLDGDASFRADEGRFLEVEAGQGALRLFSLINFSKVLNRINLDFSDVVGKGVSFDTIKASVRFHEGVMEFLEPMEVTGSGSSFRLAGKVNLIEGTLDAEMIVTLPVTKSLPWYAAYIALANPLAGLGVLVGERVLRKPLEQFSSAKYKIEGKVDEPKVSFVGVWDMSMTEVEPAAEAVDPESFYELDKPGDPKTETTDEKVSKET